MGQYRNPEELHHNLEERPVIKRNGLATAMKWLAMVADHQNLPIQSSDARTKGMQIVSPAAISYRLRLWKNRPQDTNSERDGEDGDDKDSDFEEDTGAPAPGGLEELETMMHDPGGSYTRFQHPGTVTVRGDFLVPKAAVTVAAEELGDYLRGTGGTSHLR